jgi:iron complex outermembrane receptor protein
MYIWIHMKYLISILILLFSQNVFSQSLTGKITDAETGDPMVGATVVIKGTTNGTTADADGKFSLPVSQQLPFTIVISIVGYQNLEAEIKSLDKPLAFKLKSTEVNLKDADVVASRISEKQKEAPLTVESMDMIAIKECPQASFYESLGTLKGVDLTSASLGFTIVNTRGFNSTSPVRSLQIIDGVDNQSPGLNFSLGNFLGCGELDVMRVDMIAGASTSYFGPGAFNGVISMTTRSPFVKPGLEVMFKVGERNLYEQAFRIAQVYKNKKGRDIIGIKFNLYYMKALDWEANNDDVTPQSRDDKKNPGGYDAVNQYGDEFNTGYDLSGVVSSYPGVGRYYRTGYWEKDIVDYNTNNLKLGAAFHYKITNDVELILASNYGNGTTVYQGDNRYSLKDISFFQNRIEIRKENKFFLRAYSTNEDAGKSYDAFFTALLLQKAVKSDGDWSQDYYRNWPSYEIKQYPGYPRPPAFTDPDYSEKYKQYLASINPFLYEHYYDSLVMLHGEARNYADGKGFISDNQAYLEPGTARFDSALSAITSKTSYSEGGSRFYDKSALYHIAGEYKFTPKIVDIIIGGNYRMYRPNSNGTIFSDTGGTSIQNNEAGAYAGLEKKILKEKVKLNLTCRVDKNENFAYLISPALSTVIIFNPGQIVRASFSSAIRNPTLTDQYLYYNVGRATLKGNLEGYDSLTTIPSVLNFFNSNKNFDTLEYFNVPPVRPEEVKTVEIGYRATLLKNVFVDLVCYYSWYKYFIGYKLGADVTEVHVTNPFPVNDLVVNNIYRVATNAVDEVTTQGVSVGLNYYLGKYYMLAGNYSYNKLDRHGSGDPLIPAFNTPENKFNIGFSARDLKNFGFNVNFKWVEGFQYEGSPQFTGYVPSYNMVDAQVNYFVKSIHSTLKLGASNLLNNKKFTVYGGPEVGRMAYASILVDLTN